MSTDTEQVIRTAELRAERFARLIDDYEADGPDGSVPGADRVVSGGLDLVIRSHPRYAVITESTRGFGYFANLADSMSGVEEVAGANISEGWEPVCYHDLDVLAGLEPIMLKADYQDETWMVHGYEHIHGVENRDAVVLKKSPRDKRRSTYDWATVHPDHLTDVEWTEDDRVPVRFKVAKVLTTVVFNSTPEPPA